MTTQSCFTSMVPPTLFQKHEPKFDFIEDETTPLPDAGPSTVRVATQITVNLERGQTGECYCWTREEALLIRDALSAALGQALYQPATRPPGMRPNPIRRGPTMGDDYRNGNLDSSIMQVVR